MKINETRSGHKTTKSKKAHRSDSSESDSFLKELSATQSAEVQNVSAPVTLNPLDALFSLQEIPDVVQEKEAEAKAQGEFLLDQLDQLRHALLMGTVSHDDLQKIQSGLGDIDLSELNSELQQVLSEIDLRVQVEVAKYQRDIKTL